MLSWAFLPMKRIFYAILLLAAGVLLTQPAQVDYSREIGEILTELSRITGFKAVRAIEPVLIRREQVKRFLAERIEAEIKPEELRAEELTLKKFGFLPPDFDLKATTIELLTEQAAAFYDYRKKRLYLLQSNSTALQQVALVHELAHALADQHFNLAKFVDRASENDDSAMARLAVMEGQATWLMSEYMAGRMGLSLRKSQAVVEMMSRQTEVLGGDFPIFDNAPLYLRETLLFPYAKGLLFQQAVVEKLGQAGFAEVFKRPPAGTHQIIDPEKYFAGVAPSNPKLPEFKGSRDWRVLAEGSIGELDHWILLKQYVGEEAARLAYRWKGGRYRLVENRRSGRTILEYASEWTDEAAAREFFRHYQAVLKGKWKKMDVAGSREDLLAGSGDDGFFEVRLSGPVVSSLEGLPELTSTAGSR